MWLLGKYIIKAKSEFSEGGRRKVQDSWESWENWKPTPENSNKIRTKNAIREKEDLA